MIGGLVIIVVCAATGVLSSPIAESKPALPDSKPVPLVPKPVHPAGKLLPTKPVSPLTSRQGCRAANEEFDRTLQLANQDFLENGNISVPVAGFQQDVYLSHSGASLFVKFNLKTSGGSLRLSTASRLENAMICHASSGSTPNNGKTAETLHGVLQFGELELKYDKLHAEYFKSSNLDGRLSYKVRPVVNVVVTRSTDVCRLDVVNFADTTSDEYQVTSDSWKDWIVALLVSRSLRDGGDSTPILQSVLDSLKQSVDAHFVKIWCDKISDIA